MGGPMTYPRFVSRNGLTWWGYRALDGDPHVWDAYNDPETARHDPLLLQKEYLSGELRRLEADQLASATAYASQVGITPDEAAAVLRAFLGISEPGCAECANWYGRQHGREVRLGRCGKHAIAYEQADWRT